MIFNILQLLGGLILSFGYIPQIIQIIKTKSVKDLNFKTFLSVFVGILLMEIYAVNLVLCGSGAMFLVTNTMALMLTGIMVGLILAYRKNNAPAVIQMPVLTKEQTDKFINTYKKCCNVKTNDVGEVYSLYATGVTVDEAKRAMEQIRNMYRQSD
jgi:MtN3 and saliva related transmembrane protein